MSNPFRARHSVRSFRPEPVAAAVLRAVLEDCLRQKLTLGAGQSNVA